jgi:hypothetical protein
MYVKDRDTAAKGAGPFPEHCFQPETAVRRDFNQLNDRGLMCVKTSPCGMFIVDIGFERKGSLLKSLCAFFLGPASEGS